MGDNALDTVQIDQPLVVGQGLLSLDRHASKATEAENTHAVCVGDLLCERYGHIRRQANEAI